MRERSFWFIVVLVLISVSLAITLLGARSLDGQRSLTEASILGSCTVVVESEPLSLPYGRKRA